MELNKTAFDFAAADCLISIASLSFQFLYFVARINYVSLVTHSTRIYNIIIFQPCIGFNFMRITIPSDAIEVHATIYIELK